MFEDGQFKGIQIVSRHPNIVKSVIVGKKGWGLWVGQWTDGITEWSFTREEILEEFKNRKIKIPESFLKDFDNVLQKKRMLRIEKELQNRSIA